jgi:O-antigen ligase/tetratricopeptide (TPR) repeat protein
LVPVVFDYSADFPFPVVKALLSHGVAYALVGVMAGLLVQFGRSLIVWSWIHVPVLVFLSANAIATVFALDQRVALFGTHARMLGLGTMADFVVLYFAVAILVRTRTEAIAVIASCLSASVVVLGYELVQLVGKDPFDWNSPGTLRPFSTLGQTTTLAEYLTVLVVGAVALALFQAKLGAAVRILLVGYAFLGVAGVLVTQTRSALLGIVSGAALLVLLTWLGHPNHRARLMSSVGAAVSAAAIGLVLVFTPLGARVLTTVEIPGADVTGDRTGPRIEESAEGRVALYNAVLQMLGDRPFFGYGPDNFSAAFPTYRTESEPPEIQQSLPTSAHGWAAQIAATSGLAGLVAFVTIAVVAAMISIRAGFRPLAWMAAGMLGGFLGAGITTISDVGTDWLFWASAGAIAAATARSWDVATDAPIETKRRTTHTVARLSTVPSVVALGFAALGLGLILASTGAYVASRSARDSEGLRLLGHPQLAVASALRATSGDPGRAAYWNTLGLAFISAERLTDAVPAFDRAVSLEPYNARFLGDLTSAYLLLAQGGNGSAAMRARDVAERAVRADPNNPHANLTRAIAMQVTGDLVQALRSVQRAVALDPQSSNPQLYLTGTQVLMANGRPADAVTLGRRGISVLAPTDTVPLHIELARAFVLLGQPSQALTELDIALSVRPNDPLVLQLRAQIQQGPR